MRLGVSLDKKICRFMKRQWLSDDDTVVISFNFFAYKM